MMKQFSDKINTKRENLDVRRFLYDLFVIAAGEITDKFERWYWITLPTATSVMAASSTKSRSVASSVSTYAWMRAAGITAYLKNGGALEKGVSIAIEQTASQVRLAGDFAAVSLDTKAADFTLDGYAASVPLNSAALRAHLAFGCTEGNEAIVIAAHSLDTDLGFAPGTQISYDVDAVAAMLDSALPNTAGAKPSVAIKGEYVRAAIR